MPQDALPPGWRPYRPSQERPTGQGEPARQDEPAGQAGSAGQGGSAVPDEDTHWLLGSRPPVEERWAYAPPLVQQSPPPPSSGQPQPYPEQPDPEQPGYGPPAGQYSPYGPPPFGGQPAYGHQSSGELSAYGPPPPQHPPNGPPPWGAQSAYGRPPGQPLSFGPPLTQDPGGLSVSEARKAGYLRWWALGMVVLVVVLVVAALTGGDDRAGTAAPSGPTADVTTPEAGTPAPAPQATTAAPEPEPAPEPAAVEEYSGSGAQVVTLTATDARVVQLSHSGTANFVVWAVDAQGQDIDLVANAIGSYSGTHPMNVFAREEAAALRIEADGEWTAVSAPLASAPSWDGNGTYAGDGSSVVLVEGAAEGLTPVTLTHEGNGNFAVWGYGEVPSLLVNEIGSYSGETLLPQGTVVLAVQADGPWSIVKS